MSLQAILGILATFIALLGYIPYFKDIFSGKTKPHAFSWLIWGLLTGIGFLGQLVDGAGPGAWVTGFTTIVCFTIFTLAIKKGEKNIVTLDWICLAGALVTIALWIITKTPLLSIVLITIIDVIGTIPTIRKSISKPYEETLSTYALSGLKFAVALFAIQNISFITMIYPLSLVIQNWGFVAMLVIRRRQLARN